ncbi:MAG: virulence RhuM family protein [Bacteroidales bacterium]|nr:virulence RhuM family protein [Bacteroidales bacterium]
MKDWIQRLDAILQLNGKELLTHAGEISHEMALAKSSAEYGKYKDDLRKLECKQSLQELEDDIKKLKPPENDKGKE